MSHKFNFFAIKTSTANDDFNDFPDMTLSIILSKIAEKVDLHGSEVDYSFAFRDGSGNRIGTVTRTEMTINQPDEISYELLKHSVDDDNNFSMLIECNNSAFIEDGNSEIARIVRGTAQRVANGDRNFRVRDMNGNTCGSLRWDSLEEPDVRLESLGFREPSM